MESYNIEEETEKIRGREIGLVGKLGIACVLGLASLISLDGCSLYQNSREAGKGKIEEKEEISEEELEKYNEMLQGWHFKPMKRGDEEVVLMMKPSEAKTIDQAISEARGESAKGLGTSYDIMWVTKQQFKEAVDEWKRENWVFPEEHRKAFLEMAEKDEQYDRRRKPGDREYLEHGILIPREDITEQTYLDELRGLREISARKYDSQEKAKEAVENYSRERNLEVKYIPKDKLKEFVERHSKPLKLTDFLDEKFFKKATH